MSKKINETLDTAAFEALDDSMLSGVIGGLANGGPTFVPTNFDSGKDTLAKGPDNYVVVPPIV